MILWLLQLTKNQKMWLMGQTQMNDKYRVKMIRKELYNVKNPLCRGDWKNHRRGGEEAYQQLHIKKIA